MVSLLGNRSDAASSELVEEIKSAMGIAEASTSPNPILYLLYSIYPAKLSALWMRGELLSEVDEIT
jgi:hypothetical protein